MASVNGTDLPALDSVVEQGVQACIVGGATEDEPEMQTISIQCRAVLGVGGAVLGGRPMRPHCR